MRAWPSSQGQESLARGPGAVWAARAARGRFRPPCWGHAARRDCTESRRCPSCFWWEQWAFLPRGNHHGVAKAGLKLSWQPRGAEAENRRGLGRGRGEVPVMTGRAARLGRRAVFEVEAGKT